MSGDYSRHTFDPKEHFSGVLMQQGRVQLDADWNEQVEILDRRWRAETTDVIGRSGVPNETPDGFNIQIAKGELTIGRGRIYVDGLLAENYGNEPLEFDVILAEERGTVAVPYGKQPYFPNAEVVAPIPGTGGPHLVYIDVWQREVTFLEKPDLIEKAVGVDTTARMQTVWQVRILPNVSASATCSTRDDQIPGWLDVIQPSAGRLSTAAIGVASTEDPCQVPTSGGYRGLDNRLYRVEIHDKGAIGSTTFKWSRDNGTVASTVIAIPKLDQLIVASVGRDSELRFNPGDWIEITDDWREFDGLPGLMRKIIAVDDASRTITINSVLLASDFPMDPQGKTDPKRHTRIRRWDQKGQIRDTAGNLIVDLDASGSTGVIPVPTKNISIILEDGVQITFHTTKAGGKFHIGDYWSFAARTVDAWIEELQQAPPRGMHHHYCRLALVTWNNDGTAAIKDCRKMFHPLSQLNRGCCTVTIGAGGNFETIQEGIDALKGGPGTVCVLPGIYAIQKPIRINGNDISIIGCQSTTLIINFSDEKSDAVVFDIQNSAGVVLSKLWCLTVYGSRAIQIGNSQLVEIEDCSIFAAGIHDLAGAITWQGITVTSKMHNNLIFGQVGVRYENLKVGLHIDSRIEQSIIFALQTAILETQDAGAWDFIVEDNLLLGLDRSSLGQAFLPEFFFKFAKEFALFDRETIKAAEAARSQGMRFESLTVNNIAPLLDLSAHIRAQAVKAKMEMRGEEFLAREFSTAAPVINLIWGAHDTNIINNSIAGKVGMDIGMLWNSVIASNVMGTAETGIYLQNLVAGVTIVDNAIGCIGSGIQYTGPGVQTFTISNNRITSQVNGIEFLIPEGQNYQVIANAQINGNFIKANRNGIKITNKGILIYDFTAVDNSFFGCNDSGIVLESLDENQFLPEGVVSFQRVIQRNWFWVHGTGISVALNNTNIHDNNITISYDHNLERNLSYGIIISAHDCTAANNTIEGVHNLENLFSKGGILIGGSITPEQQILSKNVVIRGNRITGGIGNGIEIGSNAEALTIESNLISDMGLNGVAVTDQVWKTDNLLIANNKILRCNYLVNTGKVWWWKHAGIVLKSGEKIQILGNIICENGKNIANMDFNIGGIYAEQVRNIIIANNQLVDNGFKSEFNNLQAVIHIPAITFDNFGNEDVKITDNLVKGSFAPALFLGGEFYTITRPPFVFWMGKDNKTIITGNHFESLKTGPVVKLQSNYCIFSNNYIECPDSPDIDAVDLGYGWFVTAIGNVASADIRGTGFFQVIEYKVIF